jgi:protoheme IX farnesyltransferase
MSRFFVSTIKNSSWKATHVLTRWKTSCVLSKATQVGWKETTSPNSIKMTNAINATSNHSNVTLDANNTSLTHDKLRYRDMPNFKLSYYLQLSKSRLSALVLLTTMTGYYLAPVSLGLVGFTFTSVGTLLCIGSANFINQWIEHPYDAQMARTKSRVLVTRSLFPAHAFLVGTASGVAGTAILFSLNPVAGSLGLLNILLYTLVYTPLKRTSILNTWVGSVVGGIPPIIGWAACTATVSLDAFLLGLLLYAWQFPHFNALSWTLRPDYSKAGYRMMSVVNPTLNAQVSLVHSLLMIPITAHLTGYDNIWFLASFSTNLYLVWYAISFWRSSDSKSARKLFFASLLHLPLVLIILVLQKWIQEHFGSEQ